jgi:hypothetical protein
VNVLLSALEGKRLGLLHEMVPNAALIAVLLNPALGRSSAASACRAWIRRTMHKLLRLAPTLLSDRCD